MAARNQRQPICSGRLDRYRGLERGRPSAGLQGLPPELQAYLDALGGLWYCNVGYGRPELAEAKTYLAQN